MALTHQQRNAKIDETLASLALGRGVVAVAMVDADGFVTHIRRDFEIDVDGLGAAVQVIIVSATRAAQNVGQHQTKLVLAENKDGLLLCIPLSRGFTLAVVADPSSMLGALRFEAREAAAELGRVLGEG